MQRRYALAGALALTTIVTFALILLGAEAGMFRDGGAKKSEAVVTTAEDDLAGALLYLAAQPTEAPAAETQYVAPEPRVTTEYVYVYEDVPAPAGQRQLAAAPTAGGQPTLPAAPTPEQEEEIVPTLEPDPTAPAPTEQPTEPAPAAPSPIRDELEFNGKVTAISGDQVTWSYSGGTITTRVVDNLDQLAVGTVAKVHAIHVSSGYVAKEIEFGGDD